MTSLSSQALTSCISASHPLDPLPQGAAPDLNELGPKGPGAEVEGIECAGQSASVHRVHCDGYPIISHPWISTMVINPTYGT